MSKAVGLSAMDPDLLDEGTRGLSMAHARGLPVRDTFIFHPASYIRALRELGFDGSDARPCDVRRSFLGVSEVRPGLVEWDHDGWWRLMPFGPGLRDLHHVLPVAGSSVPRMVMECWSRMWDDAPLAWRRERGLGPGDCPMTVMVQRMVDPEISGIMITRDANARDGGSVIQSTWGLWEGTRMGLCGHDRYVLGPSGDVIGTSIGKKTVALRCNEAGLALDGVSDGKGGTPSLDRFRLGELHALAHGVEFLVGTPAVIGWSISDGQVVIESIRPALRGEGPWLQGVGLSPGTVTGIVRTVKCCHDLFSIRRGDVLVASRAMLGYLPVLSLVSGVITDAWDQDSPTARLARERGVPAMIGAPLGSLHDGQMVRLEGDSGRITVIG